MQQTISNNILNVLLKAIISYNLLHYDSKGVDYFVNDILAHRYVVNTNVDKEQKYITLSFLHKNQNNLEAKTQLMLDFKHHEFIYNSDIYSGWELNSNENIRIPLDFSQLDFKNTINYDFLAQADQNYQSTKKHTGRETNYGQ